MGLDQGHRAQAIVILVNGWGIWGMEEYGIGLRLELGTD